MLYLIESSNYVKIGYAKDIDKRMSQYATHNPNFSLEDVTSGELSDEKELHRKLKLHRYINEWYYFNKEVALVWLDYVKKREPKMCAYDYSRCGGRTEGWKPSILYEFAVEWEDKIYKNEA